MKLNLSDSDTLIKVLTECKNITYEHWRKSGAGTDREQKADQANYIFDILRTAIINLQENKHQKIVIK